jgi:hypothetical protein
MTINEGRDVLKNQYYELYGHTMPERDLTMQMVN